MPNKKLKIGLFIVFIAVLLLLTIDSAIKGFAKRTFYSDGSYIGGDYWLNNISVPATNGLFPRQLPGPLDTWAGGNIKSIVFPVSFSGDLCVSIKIMDSHESSPPVISLYSGNTILAQRAVPPGNGVQPHQWETHGKASTLKIQLPNTSPPIKYLRLAASSGSWMVIENIEFSPKIPRRELDIVLFGWAILGFSVIFIISRRQLWGDVISYSLRLRSLALELLATFSRKLNHSSDYQIAIILFTIAFALSLSRLIFTNQSPIWDGEQYFLPYYILLSDYIRSGLLMFWNPYSAGGVPIYIDPQVAAFSPLTLVFALITGGSYSGYIYYWTFLLWFGGVGIIFLARHYKAPVWGAVVAALGFTFSGFNTGHSEHTSVIYAMAFLPHVIALIEKGVEQNSKSLIAVAGVILGIAGLGGNPGFIIIMCLFSVLWMIGKSIFNYPSNKRYALFSLITNMALITVISVLVMAPTYFSFMYDGIGVTDRVEPLTREFATQSNALDPAALLSLASPIFPVAMLHNRSLWPMTDPSSFSLYLGPLTLILSICAFLGGNNKYHMLWALALALLGIGLAFGTALPLRGWMYDYFPPSRFFRHPSFLRGYFIFNVVVLSLYGSKTIQNMIGQDNPRNSKYICFLLSITALSATLVYTSFVYSEKLILNGSFALSHIHFVTIWGCILLLAMYLYRKPHGAFVLLPILAVILACADASVNVMISTPLMSRPINAPVEGSRDVDLTANGFGRDRGNRVNTALITKAPGFITYCALNARNSVYNYITNDIGLLDMVTGPDRVWLCENPIMIPPTVPYYLDIHGRDDYISKFQCVVHTEDMMLRRETDDKKGIALLDNFSPRIVHLTPKLELYRPGILKLSVNSPSDGYLFISDRWARSWRASVNGEQATVFGGGFIFIALKAIKGENKIIMTYDPVYTKYLLVISWVIIVTVVSFAIWHGAKGSV